MYADVFQEAHCSDHSDGGRDSPAVSGTVDDEKRSKQLPRKEVTECCNFSIEFFVP